MKDAWVFAPTAELLIGRPTPRMAQFDSLDAPSPEEIVQMQQVEIRRLNSEVEKLRITANTIANTAACLAALAKPNHGDWVVVPNDVRDRMRDGVKLQVRSTEAGTEVRWATRAPDHSFDGRADG